jgi:RNA polymerase sigma factor (sigma-70 family)
MSNTHNSSSIDTSFLEKTVLAYQDGQPDAAEDLINLLAPFTYKYLQILTCRHITFNDRGTCWLLSLTARDERCRSALVKCARNGCKLPAIYRAQAIQDWMKITRSLAETYTEEDLLQELQLLILEMAKRYKKGTSLFVAYLAKGFVYELGRRLIELTKDFLTYRPSLHLSTYNDFLDYTNDAVTEEEPTLDAQDDTEIDLDANWILGATCSPAFSTLNQFERVLLKMYYEEKLTDKQIAKITGYHYITIHRKRNAAVVKLKKALEKENKLSR